MQSEYAKSDREITQFDNPITQVVRLWPDIRRLGSSDFLIEKWYALQIQDVIHDSKQQQNDR